MAQLRNQVLLDKIALRVKALRESKGLTQENFVNDTGIHIGRIETAVSNVTVSTLDAICKYFNVTLEEFFGDLPK